MSMSKRREIGGLVGWIAASLFAGAVGGLASRGAGAFYGALDTPSWAPPGAVFGPVWTVLYVLMGVAAWLVWRRGGFGGARAALTLFGFQLAFNALWTWVFFRWQDGAGAFAEILVLWGLVVATLVAFWRIRPAAGALLLPYVGWVSFAAVLTFAVWRANPGVL